MRTPPRVRRMAPPDIRTVGRSLGSAFGDDPVWRWLVPDDLRYRRRAPAAMGSIAAMHLGDGSVWMSEDGEATAVWAPPKTYRVRPRQALAAAPGVLPAVIPEWRRFLALAPMEKLHPPEPHWYLAVLGTDAAAQGRGLGSAVLAPVLARADEEVTGCYLESSKESNVPFYERHGFRVTDTYDLDGGRGPRMWLMWRDPQPPEAD